MSPDRLRGTVALVADRLTVHHRRFLRAIEAGGWRAVEVMLDPADVEGAVLARALDVVEADVVLAGPVPDVGAFTVAASPQRPVILMSWGSDLLHDVQVDPAARDRAIRAIAAAAGLIVDCRAVEVAARGLGAASEAIVRFPWGVDLAKHPFRRPVPRTDGPLRVLSLRTLAASYRVDVLVRAVARVEGVTVTLAGGGPDEDELLRLAEALGVADRVVPIGRVPEDDVAALLHGHDVHVSTAPVDGSSISLLQAMACGCPSIVTDHAANREWVDEGRTGWLVPAGDDAALATRLGSLARQDAAADLASVAQRARTRVEHDADWDRNRPLIWDLLARVTR